MVVVADSSPVIVLLNIGHIPIVHQLFGEVVVPSQVIAELQQQNRPPPVLDFIRSRPSWLLERAPSRLEPISGLHPGEIAAICLAQELKADLLLIDDLRGREAAKERKLTITGTVGVLELAADRGLVDLRDAFERVKSMDFWISHKLLDERLKLHLRRRGSR